MNYIELLTQEEKVNLCGIMGGRDFKELFKHNERDFQKIRKGFRAKSLTEELALSIAIANVDKPFIASWVNTRVQIWLDEIHENITKLEGEGSAHDIALATTMLDSFFSHDIDLYLKLAGITMDEVSRTELRTTMERIESDRAKEEKDADRIKALEEEKQRLLCQIEDCHQSASLLKTEYEQRIQEIEQEKKDLESSLAAAQEKISELQTSLTVAKSDESSHLSQYDDTDISSLPPVGSEETISLCNVISDYSGQKWLIRFADLSHNGHYHMFHRNEELPPYFANRDKIFYKDGPSTDGFYGIWSWSAIPNEKDPSKDYIISKYNVNLDAIEIAMEPDFHDGQDVYVEHTRDLEIGEIGLFVINGDGFIKQYQGDHLHSLNPEYDDIQLHEFDDAHTVGRVLGVVNKSDYPTREEQAVLDEIQREKK